MKIKLVGLALLSAYMAISAPATAKGCLRGAAAGAVGGHFVHHHAVMGAVAGCAAGHMYYKHKAHAAAHR